MTKTNLYKFLKSIKKIKKDDVFLSLYEADLSSTMGTQWHLLLCYNQIHTVSNLKMSLCGISLKDMITPCGNLHDGINTYRTIRLFSNFCPPDINNIKLIAEKQKYQKWLIQYFEKKNKIK